MGNGIEARDFLKSVGHSVTLGPKTLSDMREFVLTKLYNTAAGLTCAEAQAEKWTKQKRKKYS